ncbi:hypothetical protein [Prosthecobacter sp.]|uniref:hypothetical protein n=1 Tax=Prosthecobacter sp. TaxID=1965333 RepID=UPI00378341F0
MFLLRLGGVLLSLFHVSCVAGTSLVSDLNRQSRGLQLEALRENETGKQMLADRNRLAAELAGGEEKEEAPRHAAPFFPPEPARGQPRYAEPQINASSACKAEGL